MSQSESERGVTDHPSGPDWWKEAVVYQIYPRSFADSDGDGVGDLRGILGRLDHLVDLGVNVVWLSPVYASPNDDNGYDISDYRAINHEFGTMADFDELLAALHARGIRLVMDLVVNHTSDEHEWFRRSRSSTDDPYRDWYVWRPARTDALVPEPNNWASYFGGPAWQYDEETGEYYLHLFSRKQPDLNWENAAVRDAVYDMMRFWLDKGVDGFRMDVINMISKEPGLPDVPSPDGRRYVHDGRYWLMGPRLLEFLGEMCDRVLEGRDLITVGETPGVTPEDGVALTNPDTGPLDMVFQFEHVDLDRGPGGTKWDVAPLDLVAFKRVMSRWQDELHGRGWNSTYLSNHDQPRPVSRYGDDTEYRVEIATMLATLVHLLQGTPYIYQGDEIGMTNASFDSIAYYRDIETVNWYREAVDQHGWSPERALAAVHARSRDNARTPMQWDSSPHAGFTSGTPWLTVNPDFDVVNVAADRAAENSVFGYYQRLIRLRREYPVVVHGRYELLLAADPNLYAFTRTWGSERLLVLLNFTGAEQPVPLPDAAGIASATLLLGNYPMASPRGANPSPVTLRGANPPPASSPAVSAPAVATPAVSAPAVATPAPLVLRPFEAQVRRLP